MKFFSCTLVRNVFKPSEQNFEIYSLNAKNFFFYNIHKIEWTQKIFSRFALYRAGSRAKCPYLTSQSYGSEILNRYIGHGEFKYSTSGPTGSDLVGVAKSQLGTASPDVGYPWADRHQILWTLQGTNKKLPQVVMTRYEF